MEKFPITKKGFEHLEQKVKKLKHVDRPQIIEAKATARDFGDLSENAEYHAACEKHSFIEGYILELEDKIARAAIIDISKLSGDTIKFGATVTLSYIDTEEKVIYHIVGEYEADLSKKRVSIASPIAKALIGKKVGDIAEVHAPRGSKEYQVLEIKYQKLDL